MTEGFNLDDAIRKVPDFPKKGHTVLRHHEHTHQSRRLQVLCRFDGRIYKGEGLDAVAAIESRGFLFAAPFCDRLSLPLVLVRKKGKLPGKTRTRKYELEYGEAEIEMHEADIPEGGRVLIVDDLIATGGTVKAVGELLVEGGAVPAGVFAVVGLPFLQYEKALEGLPVRTLIEYFGE